MCGNATQENISPSTLSMKAELNAETLVTRYQITLTVSYFRMQQFGARHYRHDKSKSCNTVLCRGC